MLGRLIIIGIFSSLPIFALADEGTWLPVDLPEVVRLVDEVVPEFAPSDLQTFDEAAEQDRARYASDPTKLRQLDERLSQIRSEWREGEEVWVVDGPELPFQVRLAGRGGKLFVLLVYVPLVNLNAAQAELTFTFLSRLFGDVYPEWNAAEEWPQTSLRRAWAARVAPDRRTLVWNPDTALVQTRLGGVTSTTFGTPPDFVVYSITSREECVPDRGRNPFQRFIC